MPSADMLSLDGTAVVLPFKQIVVYLDEYQIKYISLYSGLHCTRNTYLVHQNPVWEGHMGPRLAEGPADESVPQLVVLPPPFGVHTVECK